MNHFRFRLQEGQNLTSSWTWALQNLQDFVGDSHLDSKDCDFPFSNLLSYLLPTKTLNSTNKNKAKKRYKLPKGVAPGEINIEITKSPA